MSDSALKPAQVSETTDFFDSPADAQDRPAAFEPERRSFIIRLPNGRRLVREASAMTITEAEFLAATK